MIRKLLKVEFRDALSSMLPIGVGMVALSALVALTSVLTGRLGFHSGHWDWLNALLSFATGVCFIAVLVVCFAANVNRFFRMLGEEGYVQLVLPATMGQHIAAKLIAAVATTLLTFVFLAACTFLMALPTSVNAFAAFLREMGSAIHSLGLPASLLLALFVVLGIALQFIAQILFMLVIYFVATHMEAFIDGLSQFAISLLSSPNGELKAFYGSLIGASAVEAAIDAVLWLVTQTILTKKLNLP